MPYAGFARSDLLGTSQLIARSGYSKQGGFEIYLNDPELALPLWGHGVAMALGVFLFSTNFALFYYASQSLASGLLAVVFASASLVNLFYGSVLFRTRIRLLGLVAAVSGFGGVLLLYWPEIASSRAALGALALCLCGTFSFCTGNMISSAAQRRDLPVIGSTAWDEPVFPRLIELIETGVLKPVLHKTFPLDQIVPAQKEFLKKQHIGNFVLIPPPL